MNWRRVRFVWHVTRERLDSFRSPWCTAPACTSTPESSAPPRPWSKRPTPSPPQPATHRWDMPRSCSCVWRGDEAKALNRFAWALSNANLRGEGRAIAQSRLLPPPSCTTDSAATTRRWPTLEPRASTTTSASAASPSSSSSRLRSAAASPDLAVEALRELEERTVAAGTDWALGDPGSLARAARFRRGCRGALPRGDRAAGPQSGRRASRPRSPPVRRVAATRRTDGATPASSFELAYDMFHGMGADGVRRAQPVASSSRPVRLPARAP